MGAGTSMGASGNASAGASMGVGACTSAKCNV